MLFFFVPPLNITKNVKMRPNLCVSPAMSANITGPAPTEEDVYRINFFKTTIIPLISYLKNFVKNKPLFWLIFFSF